MRSETALSLVDVAVVGGGPAGAAAATLLARWGHSVVLLTKPVSAFSDSSLAESLPPSVAKPLAALGMERAVASGRFYRSRGNTVWWGDTDTRAEPFADGRLGYQVVRRDFDELLLDQAVSAGATVCRGATVRDVDLEHSPPRLVYESDRRQRTTLAARFVLDCSGRAGVVARRGHRVAHDHPATVALVGIWHRDDGWDLPDETHTLVESYADGWAWSVPVSDTERYVTVMVDPRTTDLQRVGRVDRIYRTEVEKTQRLARLIRDARPVRAPWGRDASLYSARRYGGPGFLLVGDAASAIDPLSSCGVRKALTSGWLAAVVTRTRLRHPERDAPALELFGRRETEAVEVSHRHTATYFADVSRLRSHPFWADRAEADGSSADTTNTEVESLRQDSSVRRAFELLRQAPSIDLRVTPAVRMSSQPAVRDDEVVLEPCIVVDGWAAAQNGLRFLRGVDLPRLVSMADSCGQVPDLFDLYRRDDSTVPLPDFLGALSVLLAKGALRNLSE